MKPMFLNEVEEAAPQGPYAGPINGMRAAGVPVPQIMHLFAFKPDRTNHLAAFTQGVMRGPSPLPPGLRELIAAFTSRRNDCLFWIGSHAAVAAKLLGDRAKVDAVLEDYRTAPITEREKALFAFIERMNRESFTLQKDDIQAVIDAGWTQEAVYDAITVCALFNFYNKWVDASGVGDMPVEAYAMSGERLATAGYVPGTTTTT